MSLNNVILTSGRTINQGIALEGEKITKENERACALCEFDKEDFDKLECFIGTPVKVTTDFGEVIVHSQITEQGPHPGLIFIPMGPWANAIIDPETYGTGMPSYKGTKAKVEVIKDGKILSALELMKTYIK